MFILNETILSRVGVRFPFNFNSVMGYFSCFADCCDCHLEIFAIYFTIIFIFIFVFYSSNCVGLYWSIQLDSRKFFFLISLKKRKIIFSLNSIKYYLILQFVLELDFQHVDLDMGVYRCFRTKF